MASIPAGLALVMVAPSLPARAAAMVFALSMIGMYGTSAAYHRLPWSARARTRMRRLDHSMIFVLIAGTYTAVSLLVLHRPWSLVLVSVIWGGAAMGVVLKLVARERANRMANALYLILGWIVVLVLP